ncbi:MAG: hypothetical protein AAGE52_01305 [Myxococcota bacterium]
MLLQSIACDGIGFGLSSIACEGYVFEEQSVFAIEAFELIGSVPSGLHGALFERLPTEGALRDRSLNGATPSGLTTRLSEALVRGELHMTLGLLGHLDEDV